ncbi:MAG: sulfotransferase [Leptolyngbyaceae bacterium]|nr:sulfotransferase [Leptolyngbyaceae bacterium]
MKSPLFLIGMPRSGTKLLRGLLVSHSKIFIPRVETEFLPYWVRRWSDYGDLSKPENFHVFYQEVTKFPYFLHIQKKGTIISEKTWYEWCKGDFSVARVFEALIRHKVGLPDECEGIWGDKSPSYIGHLPLLRQLYPNAQFIHILRDVRDYSLSVQKAWGKSPVRAAQRWVDGVEQVRRDAANFPDHYLEIRYEDLLSHPDDMIRKCCLFLDVEYEDGMIEKAAYNLTENRGDAKGYTTIKSDNAQKYKVRMSKDLQRKIERIAIDTLHSCGYETSYSGKPVRVSSLPMFLYQILDGINLFLVRFKQRGILSSLKFELRYFWVSGNRN